MKTPKEMEALIAAHHGKMAYPEGDVRHDGPLTPNDPATIADVCHTCLACLSVLKTTLEAIGSNHRHDTFVCVFCAAEKFMQELEPV